LYGLVVKLLKTGESRWRNSGQCSYFKVSWVAGVGKDGY